jgi:hypothetical protein
MRPEPTPAGGTLPDCELPGHTTAPRRLSETRPDRDLSGPGLRALVDSAATDSSSRS